MKIVKIDAVGQGNHLRLTLSRDNAQINAMLFSVSPEYFPFSPGDTVDLAVVLNINIYNNKKYLSVQIKAVRPSGIDQDKLFQELRLYDAYRRGEINSKQAAEMLPSREDLAVVFRYIKANKHKRLNVIGLIYKLFDKISFSKLRICVDVLQEMGIIQINENFIQLLPISTGDKVNLADSKILNHLDTIADGVKSWAI